MADRQMLDLVEHLRNGKGVNVDFLREGLLMMVQRLMDAEVSQQIGAELYERTDDRKTQRNGYRNRRWDTRVGTIDLKVPKLREGTYFPSLLEPRRRCEQALLSVVQEAYVSGVSTRKVDTLVQALGLAGMGRSEVSRICAELDEQVEAFRTRKLEGEHPYLWLDAKYVYVRDGGQVTSMAVVIALVVNAEGKREVIGIDIGPSEEGAFWTAFLRSLVARGMKGVRLVISDAHEGLKAAIRSVLTGAAWQRCRVHFMRNLLAVVPHQWRSTVAAFVRTIFAQPDAASARTQLGKVVEMLMPRFERAARLLAEAENEVLAYMAFPKEHWQQLHSTNPLERLNSEVRRRTDVVGIFPNRTSALRLVTLLLAELQDEWIPQRRYFSVASMQKLTQPESLEARAVMLEMDA